MSEININYRGSTIASMDSSGTKTLLTSGKYCEDNIAVVYTRPSAPVPALQTKSVAFTPSETIQTSSVTADAGYDGLSAVNVSVAAIPSAYIIPANTSSITSNGVFDIKSFASVDVNVQTGVTYDEIAMQSISGIVQGSASRIGSTAFCYCNKITEASFPNASFIGASAFYRCSALTTISFPSASTIGQGAFYSCSSLLKASLPSARILSSSAFFNCSVLSRVHAPNVNTINAFAFQNCSRLSSVTLGAASIIMSHAFYACIALEAITLAKLTNLSSEAFFGCTSLATVIISGTSVATLQNSNAFGNTPMVKSTYLGYFGKIRVPASLLASYQTATNWSYYKSRIVSA